MIPLSIPLATSTPTVAVHSDQSDRSEDTSTRASRRSAPRRRADSFDQHTTHSRPSSASASSSPPFSPPHCDGVNSARDVMALHSCGPQQSPRCLPSLLPCISHSSVGSHGPCLPHRTVHARRARRTGTSWPASAPWQCSLMLSFFIIR